MTVVSKLQEALAEIRSQRNTLYAQYKALEEFDAQLCSMIQRLSGVQETPIIALSERPSGHLISTSRERDKLDDVAEILQEAKVPLHITAIAKLLSLKLGRPILRAAIEPGINRHIAKVKQPRIAKFGPSTFGLPGWRQEEQPSLTQLAS